ncbi:hypothetical protein FACS18942_01920 [Planctomycetales bacterium]|nr:hypothetical protein FACS18942_01920 [Planctomycetales bacterium]
MKTQEIVEYRISHPLEKEFFTDSYEEAKSYFDEGRSVSEIHTVRWQPSDTVKTSTTIVRDWVVK